MLDLQLHETPLLVFLFFPHPPLAGAAAGRPAGDHLRLQRASHAAPMAVSPCPGPPKTTRASSTRLPTPRSCCVPLLIGGGATALCLLLASASPCSSPRPKMARPVSLPRHSPVLDQLLVRTTLALPPSRHRPDQHRAAVHGTHSRIRCACSTTTEPYCSDWCTAICHS